MITVTDLSAMRSQDFTLRIKHLSLPAGAITCIAGPNGGGKTTLVECLTGLLKPEDGIIRMGDQTVGRSLQATKSLIGYIPDDEHWLIAELCAEEYFALLEGVYHQAGTPHNMRQRTQYLAAQLHFTALRQPLGSLSHGNKKKVQMIAGLMHQPPVLIVDELRNGLDPLAAKAAEQLLQEEAKRGACIVAATHDLWWAERVAKQVILLVHGAVAANTSVAKARKQHGSLEALFMQVAGAS